MTLVCGSCNACCRNTLVILAPGETDYAAMWADCDGQRVRVLQSKAYGDCVYLDRKAGCTIHDRKPRMCREYDCRVLYVNLVVNKTRKARLASVALGGIQKDVLAAGRRQLRKMVRENVSK